MLFYCALEYHNCRPLYWPSGPDSNIRGWTTIIQDSAWPHLSLYGLDVTIIVVCPLKYYDPGRQLEPAVRRKCFIARPDPSTPLVERNGAGPALYWCRVVIGWLHCEALDFETAKALCEIPPETMPEEHAALNAINPPQSSAKLALVSGMRHGRSRVSKRWFAPSRTRPYRFIGTSFSRPMQGLAKRG